MSGPLRLALAAFAVALTLAVGALARALHVEASSAVATEKIVMPRLALSRAESSVALQTVWDDDPFSPGRTRAAERYRPGRVSAAESAEPRESRLPTVLGTVVATQGKSFATCDPGNGPPKHVRVGDTIGGYVVDSIARGRVVFLAPSGRRVEARTTRTQD